MQRGVAIQLEGIEYSYTKWKRGTSDPVVYYLLTIKNTGMCRADDDYDDILTRDQSLQGFNTSRHQGELPLLSAAISIQCKL